MNKKQNTIRQRLEELRTELRAERISYGELAELQSLADNIDESDVELLEAAGVPEGSIRCPACKKYTTCNPPSLHCLPL